MDVKKHFVLFLFLFLVFLNNTMAGAQNWEEQKKKFLKTLKVKGIPEAIIFGEDVISKVDFTQKGNLSSETCQFLFYLGSICRKQGSNDKALAYLNRALEVTEVIKLNLNDPLIGKISESLAEMYSLTRDNFKAEYFYKRALQVKKTNFGENHYKIANSYILMGKFYKRIKNIESSKSYFQMALTIRRNHFGAGHLKTAAVLVNLGELCILDEDIKAGEEFFKDALKIFLREGKKATYGVIVCKDNLAYIYRLKGNIKKSLKAYTQLLSIKEKHFGVEHIQVANTLNNMATIYIGKDNNKVEPLLQRALKICESSKGIDQSILLKVLENLSLFYEETGQEKKKKETQMRMQTILKGEKNEN